jgi:hypothetical protein
LIEKRSPLYGPDLFHIHKLQGERPGNFKNGSNQQVNPGHEFYFSCSSSTNFQSIAEPAA